MSRERDGRLGPRIAWHGDEAGRRVRAAGLVWHVQSRPPGSPADSDAADSGPSALLVHGTGASSHSWEPIADRLPPGIRALAPDLPGHGLSDVPPSGARMDSGTMAKWLAGLVEELDLRPVLLVGHSAGAAIVLRLAASLTRPVAVVGVAPALGLPGGASRRGDFSGGRSGRWLSALVRSRAAGKVASLAARLGATDRILARAAPDLPDRSRRTYRALASHPVHAGSALRMMSDWDPEGVRAAFSSVSSPTLLLAGERDPWFPPEAVARAAGELPCARVSVVAGSGHVPHEESPEAVADRISSFWREVTGGSPRDAGGPRSDARS